MDADALVVGAGPTGLMLATRLRRHGLRVIVIEKNAGPVRETRALGVHARTLEFYAQLGIADRAIAEGRIATGADLWAEGEHKARVPLGDTGRTQTPYPYVLVLGQDANERLLGDALREAGGEVRWNTTLLALEQRVDRVVATVRDERGAEHALTVGWVAGCDGAHSAVRHLVGIDFPGAPYEHVFFVADVRCRGSMVAREVNAYLWRSGFHLLFPMRGEDHWRLVGIVPPEFRDASTVRFEDVQQAVVRQVGGRFQIDDCTWFATYRIHHRRAQTFRRGRCFLLGDAAHIHSPVGAQGMNTGLQDACNLAWKLAWVAGGRASDTLLDTYDEERGAVAQRLLDSTDRAFRFIVADGPLTGLLRTRVVARFAALLMRRPRIQGAVFRTVSQIGIHYRDARLAREAGEWPTDAPRAGDRFPWITVKPAGAPSPVDVFTKIDGSGFVLLVFGQDLPGGSVPAGVVATLVVPEAPELPTPCYFLVRPDGYIALRGRQLDPDAVGDYLAELKRASFARIAVSCVTTGAVPSSVRPFSSAASGSRVASCESSSVTGM